MWPAAATALAAIGMATAGAAVAVHSGIVPPGIATAMQSVPTWTHAHSVLESLQSAFAGGTHPSPANHPGR
jgi:hypothetical protein